MATQIPTQSSSEHGPPFQPPQECSSAQGSQPQPQQLPVAQPQQPTRMRQPERMMAREREEDCDGCMWHAGGVAVADFMLSFVAVFFDMVWMMVLLGFLTKSVQSPREKAADLRFQAAGLKPWALLLGLLDLVCNLIQTRLAFDLFIAIPDDMSTIEYLGPVKRWICSNVILIILSFLTGTLGVAYNSLSIIGVLWVVVRIGYIGIVCWSLRECRMGVQQVAGIIQNCPCQLCQYV